MDKVKKWKQIEGSAYCCHCNKHGETAVGWKERGFTKDNTERQRLGYICKLCAKNAQYTELTKKNNVWGVLHA